MTSCGPMQLLVTLLLSVGVMMTAAFTMGGSISSSNSNYAAMARATTFSRATPETVEVCGFKDCKRAGGGPRLEKLVNSVLEEKGLVDAVKVEGCDCQGECGYGPNLVIDGKIVNSVKGKDAVIKALGLDEEERFCERGIYGHIQSGRSTQLQNTDDNYAEMDDSEGDEENESELEVENIYSELEIDQNDDLPSPIEDLSWRVEKLRLEEANTRRFLKAGPRFLPYEECRKWVQAWDRWDCEDDWVRWIDEGEKRNSYIPARPDEYYGKLGKWKGWDHFLGKDRTDDFQ